MSAQTISKALQELEVARKNVKRISNRQVRKYEDRAALQATALAWFHTHRPAVLAGAEVEMLAKVDAEYTIILNGADRNTTKKTHLDSMKSAKDALVELKTPIVIVDTRSGQPGRRQRRPQRSWSRRRAFRIAPACMLVYRSGAVYLFLSRGRPRNALSVGGDTTRERAVTLA